jgi:GTP-binding protein
MLRPNFIGSFPQADVSLDPAFPEVALIGRSNVGKSSLLNALTGQKIAKVSGTPGKTRMLNVYAVPVQIGVGAQHAAPLRQTTYYLLDLPGYGYSRASHTDRRAFRLLIEHTLNRGRLAGVVWLLDIRHDPSKDDLEIQRLLVESGRPVLAALTKGDKLGRAAAQARARALAATLGLDQDQVQLTSSKSRQGIAELGQSILATIGGDR